jgi:hypothetical protein
VKRLAAAISFCSIFLCGSIASPADLVMGDQNFRNVTNLTSQMRWYDGLAQAEWEAKRDGKLVFWLHMLGNLSGAT